MKISQLIAELQKFPYSAEVTVGAWFSPKTKKLAELDPVLSIHYGRVIISTDPIDENDLVESLKTTKYVPEIVPIKQYEEAVIDPNEAVRKANESLPAKM